MIEELALPLVDSETIFKEIARLIKDPDCVRRSRSSIDVDELTMIFKPASANLKTVLFYGANPLNGPKG
jgi:hypothetical protein